MSKKKRLVFSLLLMAMGLLLAWRILVVGLGDHFARKAQLGDKEAVDSALMWNSNNPKALFLKGYYLRDKDPKSAMELLRQAIVLNPGDGPAMQSLAWLLLKQQQPEQADGMMLLAVERMPASKTIHLQAAEYWLSRGKIDRAVENWATALELDSKLGARIYPMLARLAENPATLGVLKKLLQAPPPWWDDFFEYLATNTRKLETLVNVATLRHATEKPLSGRERELLVERLQKEAQWPEAYLVWINGLTPEQHRYLGSVFDGGFEIPPGKGGFFWQFPENNAWLIRRKHTYGSEGEKSLHILYKGSNTPVKQVYQYLLLGKGEYLLQLRFRVDRLRIASGLHWVVRCAGGEERILGSTTPLVGASDWDLQQLHFKVPNTRDCRGQLLRLEISDAQGDSQSVEGEVWFDRFSIRKLP
ncbi:tetratricopeptide repeat protein [Thiolapillus brandeum]|uniref:Tetratricopeptide repeat protein n=1 Tax=Thiolapillus brandeum TaxID=1076588 RepID=A0A7U6GHC3_9GAMM|nr:tetratricopeptide repeat protein [Thiolapillus brandeum]BAO43669.1 conserved hypothetical protein [Thiolapillus brandeum]